jgi:isocitrate/isopropylmalate dehydrogenase
MMLRHMGLYTHANRIERAAYHVLREGKVRSSTGLPFYPLLRASIQQ